ncbi:unnamed protein product [Soboliphyme baturini]|uniref:CHK domain-containing protein n=1 Tax=Soboliphyme baturini TaxID=241478 RepID=A0A183IUD2_9BILA|nr:unnamed protein product [Soboliphyme baturini]
MYLACKRLYGERHLPQTAIRCFMMEETRETIEKAFMHYYHRSLALEEIHGVDLSQGKGFMSVVTLYALKWDSDYGSLDDIPETVILKVPNPELLKEFFCEMMRQRGLQKMDFDFDWIAKAHDNECVVYSLFGREPPVPVPICYKFEKTGKSTKGMLMLQNMNQTGTMLEDPSVPLNLTQVNNLVDIIAKLQGWSLTKNTAWRKKLPTHRDQLKPLIEMDIDLKREAIQMSREVLKAFGVDVDVVVVVRTMSEKFLDEEEEDKGKHAMPVVFVHGDLWVNNIVFKTTSEGKAGDEIEGILDWQLSHVGACVEDLAHLTVWCMATSMRRAETAHILHRFCNAVFHATKQKVKLSFEEVEHAFNHYFVLETMLLVFKCRGLLDDDSNPNTNRVVKNRKDFGNRVASCYEDAVKILNGKMQTEK